MNTWGLIFLLKFWGLCSDLMTKVVYPVVTLRLMIAKEMGVPEYVDNAKCAMETFVSATLKIKARHGGYIAEAKRRLEVNL